MSEIDLKKDNVAPLTALVTFSVLAIGLVELGLDSLSAGWAAARDIGMVACTGVLAALLSNIVSRQTKHRLVFLRWKHPDAGYRCRELCERDPRLNAETLKSEWPQLFADSMPESDQNSYWYQNIFKGVQNHLPVLQAHRSFLLYRDALVVFLLMMMSSVLWKLFGSFIDLPFEISWISVVILFAFVFLTNMAARSSGNRLVCNSVATACSTKK